jgi:hypothetical protein
MKVVRILARAYASPEGMDQVIGFYEKLLGERCLTRFSLPGLGLDIASVGAVHVLAGTDEKLKPFRHAHATFFVDSVASAQKQITAMGAEVLIEPAPGPGPSFMVARHPDGLVVEYIDQPRG